MTKNDYLWTTFAAINAPESLVGRATCNYYTK